MLDHLAWTWLFGVGECNSEGGEGGCCGSSVRDTVEGSGGWEGMGTGREEGPGKGMSEEILLFEDKSHGTD